MKVHVMTTGTSSRPERIEETERIEALKKKFAATAKIVSNKSLTTTTAASR